MALSLRRSLDLTFMAQVVLKHLLESGNSSNFWRITTEQEKHPKKKEHWKNWDKTYAYGFDYMRLLGFQ